MSARQAVEAAIAAVNARFPNWQPSPASEGYARAVAIEALRQVARAEAPPLAEADHAGLLALYKAGGTMASERLVKRLRCKTKGAEVALARMTERGFIRTMGLHYTTLTAEGERLARLLSED